MLFGMAIVSSVWNLTADSHPTLAGLGRSVRLSIQHRSSFNTKKIPLPKNDSAKSYFVNSGEVAPVIPSEILQRDTSFYDLAITKWKLPFLSDSGVSGPFVILDEGEFLFLSRCGKLSVVKQSNGQMALLLQRDLPFQSEIYCEDVNGIPLTGVKGMHFIRDENTLLVSHHVMASENCVALRISKVHLDLNDLTSRDREIIFESKPCLPKDQVVYTQAGGVFTEDQKRKRIYFSVGDFGPLHNAQDYSKSYGNIWFYDRNKNVSYRIAMGARNAQGLDYDARTNTLFESEHGPKGGDEINVVNYGDNFGWPRSSYGIDYSFIAETKSYDGRFGRHSFGEKPEYVFFPSEAITGMRIYPRSPYFESWNDDLILASLKGNTIFRLKTDKKKIVYAEPVANLKERLRTVEISQQGIIYVKADPDFFFEMKIASDTVYDQKNYGKELAGGCVGCHTGAVGAAAPNLYGQKEEHFLRNMRLFASGERKNENMNSIAKALNERKRIALAKYFSSAHKI